VLYLPAEMKKVFEYSPRNYQFLFWSWLVIILIVSSIPRLPDPSIELKSFHLTIRTDYILHFLQYAILGGLFVLWQGLKDKKISYRTLLIALVIGIAFASLDEYHQHYIPGRRYNPVDMFYNMLGIISGLIFTALYLRRMITKGMIR
jgi:VanZ family protein